MKFDPYGIGHRAINSDTACISRIRVALTLISSLRLNSQHTQQTLHSPSDRQALASVRTILEWAAYVHVGLWGYAPIIGCLVTILLLSLDQVALRLACIALLILLSGVFVGVSAFKRAMQRMTYWQEQAQALAQQVAKLQQQLDDGMQNELDSLRPYNQKMAGVQHMGLHLDNSDLEMLEEKRKIPPHQLRHFMQFVKGLTRQYECTSVSAEVILFPGQQPTKKTGQA